VSFSDRSVSIIRSQRIVRVYFTESHGRQLISGDHGNRAWRSGDHRSWRRGLQSHWSDEPKSHA